MQSPTCLTSSRSLCKWLLPCFLLAWSHVASATDSGDETTSAAESNLDVEFAQAADAFKAGEFAKALASFVALSQRTESPNVQLYIGYCQLRLGRATEAHQAFSRAIEGSEASRSAQYGPTRDAARKQLLALDPQLSKLTVSLVEAPPQAVVKLDGRTLNASQLGSRLTIEPGVHVIKAEAPGALTLVETVKLEKGNAKTVVLLLQSGLTRVPERDAKASGANSSPQRATLMTVGWVTAGLGVVGWGVFTVAGLRAKSLYGDLQAQCRIPCSDAAHRDTANAGKAWQTGANVGLAVGVLGTLSAASFFIWGSQSGSVQRTLANIQFGSGSAQLSYEGRF